MLMKIRIVSTFIFNMMFISSINSVHSTVDPVSISLQSKKQAKGHLAGNLEKKNKLPKLDLI